MKRIKTIIAVSSFVSFFCLSIVFAGDCVRAIDLYNQATITMDMQARERLFKEALVIPCTDNTILAMIQNNLGDTYENANRLDQSIREYNKAIELSPNFPTPYISLGDVHSKMGKHDKASQYYNQYWNLVSFKTRSQLIDTLSLRSAKRAVLILPIPSTDLYFDFNESTLTEKSRNQLEELLAAINGNELQDYTFVLRGHTSDIGPDAYSQNLSEMRAESVKKWLVANGIPATRLLTRGFGMKSPIADGTTEEGKRLNRRVEISPTGAVIIGKRSKGKGVELVEKGWSLSNRENFGEAATYFEKALDIFRGGQAIYETKVVLINLYLTYLAVGNIDGAFQCQRDLQRIR
jgi:outer membrane protein OmpA-like peptidoglycan-associated protein